MKQLKIVITELLLPGPSVANCFVAFRNRFGKTAMPLLLAIAISCDLVGVEVYSLRLRVAYFPPILNPDSTNIRAKLFG